MDIKKPGLDCDWIKQESNFQTARFFKDLELSKWLKSIVNVEIT
jgi:hypothetical protein